MSWLENSWYGMKKLRHCHPLYMSKVMSVQEALRDMPASFSEDKRFFPVRTPQFEIIMLIIAVIQSY